MNYMRNMIAMTFLLTQVLFFQVKDWSLCYIFFYGDTEWLKYNSSLINNFLASVSD